jgi:hypothetical protein
MTEFEREALRLLAEIAATLLSRQVPKGGKVRRG